MEAQQQLEPPCEVLFDLCQAKCAIGALRLLEPHFDEERGDPQREFCEGKQAEETAQQCMSSSKEALDAVEEQLTKKCDVAGDTGGHSSGPPSEFGEE